MIELLNIHLIDIKLYILFESKMKYCKPRSNPP